MATNFGFMLTQSFDALGSQHGVSGAGTALGAFFFGFFFAWQGGQSGSAGSQDAAGVSSSTAALALAAGGAVSMGLSGGATSAPALGCRCRPAFLPVVSRPWRLLALPRLALPRLALPRLAPAQERAIPKEWQRAPPLAARRPPSTPRGAVYRFDRLRSNAAAQLANSFASRPVGE